MIKECNETLKRFHNGGASLIEGIELPMAYSSDEEMSVFDKILDYELKNNLDSYLASLKNTSIHSVSDLVSWNVAHPDLAYAKGGIPSFLTRRDGIDDAKLLQIMEAAEKTSVQREIPDMFKYGTLREKRDVGGVGSIRQPGSRMTEWTARALHVP